MSKKPMRISHEITREGLYMSDNGYINHLEKQSLTKLGYEWAKVNAKKETIERWQNARTGQIMEFKDALSIVSHEDEWDLISKIYNYELS